jgi:hypothetical protein
MLLAGVTAAFLLGLFSPEIYDTDFWWHLRTGRYIVQTRSLPSPDPFAWTTAMAPNSYPGEARTRQFNLTHEWLAQAAIYGVWRVAGFAGVVAVRAVSMTLVCGLVGLIAWEKRRNFLLAITAALAAASVLSTLALDRPYQVTFLFLAVTLAVLEYRRWLWLLPPLFLIWANCHGGYFLGWVALGTHCAESLIRRKRDTRLWIISALCIALSAANPNGLAIFRTLLDYRVSFMQSKLLEWAPPRLWPLSWFSALLLAGLVALVIGWRKVRPADWLLFLAFAAASLTAQRNVFLTALISPVLVVSAGSAVFPGRHAPILRGILPTPAVNAPKNRGMAGPKARATVAVLLMAAGLVIGIVRGAFFQLHVAEWRFPSGAADFLRKNHITGRMFNTYEYGGYLMWRLWPQQRVFIDGRALSESVFQDYARILYNHDDSDGLPSSEKLLDDRGIDVIVMNTFEPSGGTIYLLAPSLADPNQSKFKLVYQDARALVFLRTLPPGLTALPSMDIFTHMESECAWQIDHEPQYTRCARSLGQIFSRLGDFPRARNWVGTYLQRPHDPDPQAEEAWQRLNSVGQ